MSRRQRPPLILLPPSEGKSVGGRGASWSADSDSFGELDDDRARVMAALQRAMRSSAANRQKLLGVKGDALAAATAANLAVTDSATRPAIERYTGVLYDALDYAGLPAAQRRRADDQIVIASGLFGLVTPCSPIPDYKLKMGATLPRLGRLSTFWKPKLTASLTPLVEDRVVWDLLPNEHAAAWSPATTAPSARYSVRFLDDVGSGTERRLITVSHWNKLLKGALVRYVLAHQLTSPDSLTEFDHPEGYRYRPDLTEDRSGLTMLSLVSRR